MITIVRYLVLRTPLPKTKFGRINTSRAPNLESFGVWVEPISWQRMPRLDGDAFRLGIEQRPLQARAVQLRFEVLGS